MSEEGTTGRGQEGAQRPCSPRGRNEGCKTQQMLTAPGRCPWGTVDRSPQADETWGGGEERGERKDWEPGWRTQGHSSPTVLPQRTEADQGGALPRRPAELSEGSRGQPPGPSPVLEQVLEEQLKGSCVPLRFRKVLPWLVAKPICPWASDSQMRGTESQGLWPRPHSAAPDHLQNWSHRFEGPPSAAESEPQT